MIFTALLRRFLFLPLLMQCIYFISKYPQFDFGLAIFVSMSTHFDYAARTTMSQITHYSSFWSIFSINAR